MNRIIKWWKRRNFDLRQACIGKYSKEFGEKAGEEIGEMYDSINRGIPIGGFLETTVFLDMVEKVKKESGLYLMNMNYKEKFEDFLSKMQGLLDNAKKQGHIIVRVEDLENAFPELKENESEDERIRKDCIKYLDWEYKHCPLDKDRMKIEKCIVWLEKQCQQKTDDKPEPKFKVGDWVFVEQIDNIINGPRKIKEVNDYGYVLDGIRETVLPFTSEHCMRLWTIQDAKNGDVLNSPSHHLIWIYKDNENYHACVNMNYVTENVATNGLISIPNDACPATKDERTILFSNVEKSGYEWDAEKKELKKIENEHICELDNLYTCVKFPFKAKVKSSGTIVAIHGGQLSPDGKEWIKYQSDNEDGYKIYEPNNLELVCEIEQKPVWSDEDEHWRQKAIDFMKHPDLIKATPTLSKDTIDWLKSLKDRYTWKPSEEQMEALLYEVNAWDEDSVNGQNLKSLYQDLKKLREE